MPHTQYSTDLQYARDLDALDAISHLRNDFLIPSVSDLIPHETTASTTTTGTVTNSSETEDRCLYFSGNSLGLQPKAVKTLIEEELSVWARKGVHGHTDHAYSRPWVSIDETVTSYLADIVGAQLSEVAVMGTLTSNLHILMASFYRPTAMKYKIIIEEKAFPSDHYAVESQIQLAGYKLSEALVTISPEDGRSHLTTEQICQMIDRHAESTSLILLPGVQYYTGQAFEMEKITKHAHEREILIGWDLAHAIGNIPLQMHEWEVDFAVWCSYKYLNSGPGGIAGLFVHEQHACRPRLTGWWGHKLATRFIMSNEFHSIVGAGGFQLSNPSVISTICLLASLQVFAKTNMKEIREKSVKITGYLEFLLSSIKFKGDTRPFEITTPRDPAHRGAQLSIMFKDGIMERVSTKLKAQGIVADERKPDVIRVAPVPLYNTYEDVWKFCQVLEMTLLEL